MYVNGLCYVCSLTLITVSCAALAAVLLCMYVNQWLIHVVSPLSRHDVESSNAGSRNFSHIVAQTMHSVAGSAQAKTKRNLVYTQEALVFMEANIT